MFVVILLGYIIKHECMYVLTANPLQVRLIEVFKHTPTPFVIACGAIRHTSEPPDFPHRLWTPLVFILLSAAVQACCYVLVAADLFPVSVRATRQ